jgi:hypothetical protein
MNPLEKAQSSKTFCIYPWMHQYVGPEGEVKPCCLFAPNDKGLESLKNKTLAETWNSDKTKQLRLDMLNGVEIPACVICNNKNNLVKPHRVEANELWMKDNANTVLQTREDGSLPEHKLKYIDARFNNLCNFKCRTCSPQFSTSWHEDYEEIRNKNEPNKYPKSLLIPGNTEDQLLNEILPHLETVNKIYFAGGEPLMQIEHYRILEELIRLNHLGTWKRPLVLQYSTNFSNLNLGKYNALDYWKKFARVFVMASIDGSYKRAEYWRKGTDWDKIVNNVKNLQKECPNVKLRLGYTLSWINAFNLVELHKEWVDLKYLHIDNINLNMLDSPPSYCLKSLPNWKKEKIKHAFLNHIEWLKEKKAHISTVKQFEDAITFMNGKDNNEFFANVEEFTTLTEKLDKLRNENFWDVFPEHNDMKELIYGSNAI